MSMTAVDLNQTVAIAPVGGPAERDPLFGIPASLPYEATHELKVIYGRLRKMPVEYLTTIAPIDNDVNLSLRGRAAARLDKLRPFTAAVEQLVAQFEAEEKSASSTFFELAKQAGVSPTDPAAVARHQVLFAHFLAMDDLGKLTVAQQAAERHDREVLLALHVLPAFPISGSAERVATEMTEQWRRIVREALQTIADPTKAAFLPAMQRHLDWTRGLLNQVRVYFAKEVEGASVMSGGDPVAA